MFFDPLYILMVMLPTMVISGIAQAWISNAYQKWSNIPNTKRVTGQQVAQILMREGGLARVGLEVSRGQMSDHYDPTSKTVRLSPNVATQPSVASLAIAAHEFGHVQQDQQNSPMMALRSMLVPAAQIGPSFGIILMILGLVIGFTGLSVLGLILFAGVAVFTLVTLPVELDASRRALKLMQNTGLLASVQDEQGARAVLRAAAFTYVAALLSSLLTLAYWAMVVFGSSRD
ncbi:MAG: zinc metallopeptidase [Chloroflexi bacterium]|nr:zinc metallopeptidase [Chloroflexota bacterium]